MLVPTLKASHNNGDNWVLHLVPLLNHGLVASLSNGAVNVYPFSKSPGRDFAPIRTIKAHNNMSINALRSVDGKDIFATASDDGLKVFDLRNSSDQPIAHFTNERNIPFLSLDIRGNLIAGGTELKSADAELHIWDLKTKQLVRSFVDSHHDDITEIKFHPTEENYLLSGSTDGYVNVYDLSILEEDEAVHQVINFASIHSAGWLTSNRIYTLSHMETFAIHELNDKTEVLSEPKSNDFGDVRKPWNCEYVIDVYPGFIATGANSRSFACIYTFANEQVNLDTAINLNGAHGEEVIRTVYIPPNSNLIYTGGEDGSLKVWKSDYDLDFPRTFFDASQNTAASEVIDDNSIVVDENEKNPNSSETEENEGKKEKEEKQKKEKEKNKRDKKYGKEKKGKKTKKTNKDLRFKPY